LKVLSKIKNVLVCLLIAILVVSCRRLKKYKSDIVYDECDSTTEISDKNYIYNEVIDLNHEIVVFKKNGCRQYSITTSYAGRQKQFHLDYRGTKR